MKILFQTFKEYGNLLKENNDNKQDTIDTSIDIFNGIEDGTSTANPITTNNKKYNHLYDQLDSTTKLIYDKLYENKENLKTGTFRIDFGNQFQTLLSQSNGEKELKQKYQSAIEVLIYENPEIFYLDATKMFINIEKTTKLDNKYFLPSHIVIKSLNNKYKQIEKIQ